MVWTIKMSDKINVKALRDEWTSNRDEPKTAPYKTYRSVHLELWQEESWWHCRIIGTGLVFKSLEMLWAQSDALKFYADELYRIKKTTTPMDFVDEIMADRSANNADFLQMVEDAEKRRKK